MKKKIENQSQDNQIWFLKKINKIVKSHLEVPKKKKKINELLKSGLKVVIYYWPYRNKISSKIVNNC